MDGSGRSDNAEFGRHPSSAPELPLTSPDHDPHAGPDNGDRRMKDVHRGYVTETLFYVPTLARRYMNRGLNFDELIAAGNLGLVEAALRFDPDRNVLFTTYANWWIRKSMIEALGLQSGPMRLPRYQYDKLKFLRDTRARWVTRFGRQPDSQDLAAAAGLALEEVDRLMNLVTGVVSLEQPLTASDERPLKDTLQDTDVESPHRALIRRDLSERLHRQLGSLPVRERQVLTLRFGLCEDSPLTLRETGVKLGISRERVRQVEMRALGKLKDRI